MSAERQVKTHPYRRLLREAPKWISNLPAQCLRDLVRNIIDDVVCTWYMRQVSDIGARRMVSLITRTVSVGLKDTDATEVTFKYA